MPRASWRLTGSLLCLLLAACTGSEPQESTNVPRIETTVFYGTNRNRRDDTRPGKFYGEGRGQFEQGMALLSGADQASKTRLEAVSPMPRELFIQKLRDAIGQADEPDALVFVHGYLRSFRQAGKVLAEFVEQTDFPGVPVLWSWPSTSNPARYTVDETNIMWAQRDFDRFLQDVLTDSGARTVHLVGHSLGGRGLVTVTLLNLRQQGVDLSRVGQFVLLAPDIDEDIFRRDMAPALVDAGLRVTLYTSANDKALLTAYRVHGHRRAGDSSEGPLLFPGIETIDVTAANRSILGHSYFEESEVVAQDLAQLLNTGLPAGQRDGLAALWRDGIQYWQLTMEQ